MSIDTNDLLTLSEAARELRVSHEQVRSLCIAGSLPFVVVSPPKSGKIHRRIRRETLERFKRNERLPGVESELRQISSVARKLAAVEQVW
jgi:excisionase family DNA binding protein